MKIGDKVVVIDKISSWWNNVDYQPQFIERGMIFTIKDDFIDKHGNGKYFTFVELPDSWAFEFQLSLINNFNNMDIKEKFLTSLKKEPEKSFRKAGITNGDDLITEDGKSIFMSWLLKKHGEEFKKEVVDEILKEEIK